MDEIKLTITGQPIAKKRPRFVRRGAFVGTYNPQETEEGRWLWEARQQWAGQPMEGPVSLDVLFVMPIPKSASKKAKAAMLAGEVWHTKKPDLDNMEKWVCDCLNGSAWGDDSQVVSMSSRKIYGESPRTEIVIRSMASVAA